MRLLSKLLLAIKKYKKTESQLLDNKMYIILVILVYLILLQLHYI